MNGQDRLRADVAALASRWERKAQAMMAAGASQGTVRTGVVAQTMVDELRQVLARHTH